MKVQFVKLSPTQNMTILVESPVDRAKYLDVANSLMRYDGVNAEQVGFIEKPQNPLAWARLQMSGGEFCGNATMSLATFLAWQREMPEGECIEVPLEVSGAEGVIVCSVQFFDGVFWGTVHMSTPEKIEEIPLSWAGRDYVFTAVSLPGITHLIVPLDALGSNPQTLAEQAIREWASSVRTEAFGILLYDPPSCAIEPLVYVKASAALVWERGCGSGSAAVGAYLAHLTSSRTVSRISQPGGVIEVDARYASGRVSNLSITGSVKIVARGTAYIA